MWRDRTDWTDWSDQSDVADGDTPLGLHLLTYRYYDSQAGRFVTRDPIGYAGGMNLYSYVGNSPLAFADPLGLCADPLDGNFGSWGALWGSAARHTLTTDPTLRPGSAQRVQYSQILDWVPGVGAVKGAYQALTGRDPVAGTSLSSGGRVLASVGAGAPGVGLLGRLAGRSGRVSQRGLDIVERHIASFGADPPNAAMIARLRQSLAAGKSIEGADLSFYMHELNEATRMGRGVPYDPAHAAAVAKYGVSEYSIYHPEVISTYREYFAPGYRKAWGLE